MAANIDSNLANWSTTDSSNQPDGTDPADIDAELRRLQAVVRKYTRNKGADIASASTTDLSTATGDYVDITGTTTITSFGTVSVGMRFILQFDNTLTLTHSSALVLPGAANITTAAGDHAVFESLGSGNWVCVAYTRASGLPAKAGANSDITSLGALASVPSVVQSVVATAKRKNLLTNGSMRVSQRGGSATVSTTDMFVCDRWRVQVGSGGGSITLTKEGSSGLRARSYGKATYLSGTVSNVLFRQRIEDNVVNGVHNVGSLTVSLKVASNHGSAQNWTVGIYKPTSGSENSWGGGDTLVQSQTLSAAGTGSWVSLTHTFTGLTEADVLNGLSLRVTTPALTSGQYASIGEVQLEEGASATEFELRSYAEELALCKRYFQAITQMTGYYNATTSVVGNAVLPVEMRTVPSVSASGVLSFFTPTNSTQFNQSSANVSINSGASSPTSLYLSCGNFSGLTNSYYVMNGSSSVIYADAEL